MTARLRLPATTLLAALLAVPALVSAPAAAGTTAPAPTAVQVAKQMNAVAASLNATNEGTVTVTTWIRGTRHEASVTPNRSTSRTAYRMWGTPGTVAITASEGEAGARIAAIDVALPGSPAGRILSTETTLSAPLSMVLHATGRTASTRLTAAQEAAVRTAAQAARPGDADPRIEFDAKGGTPLSMYMFGVALNFNYGTPSTLPTRARQLQRATGTITPRPEGGAVYTLVQRPASKDVVLVNGKRVYTLTTVYTTDATGRLIAVERRFGPTVAARGAITYGHVDVPTGNPIPAADLPFPR